MPILFYILLLTAFLIFLWIMYVCIRRLNDLIRETANESIYRSKNEFGDHPFKLPNEYVYLNERTSIEVAKLRHEIEALKRKEAYQEKLYSLMIKSLITKYDGDKPTKHSSPKDHWVSIDLTENLKEMPSIKYTREYQQMSFSKVSS